MMIILAHELSEIDAQIAKLQARRREVLGAMKADRGLWADKTVETAHALACVEVDKWASRKLTDLALHTDFYSGEVIRRSIEGSLKIEIRPKAGLNTGFEAIIRAKGLGDLSTSSGRTRRGSLNSALAAAKDELARRAKIKR